MFFSPHVEYEVYEVGRQTWKGRPLLMVTEARPRKPVVSLFYVHTRVKA